MALHKARLKISQYSKFRKHKDDEAKHKMREASLSLTSMVDMFAILVIFLIANNDNNQWLQVRPDVDLPKAAYYDMPPQGATIQISEKAIYGDKGVQIVPIAGIMTGPDVVEPLVTWLRSQRKDGEEPDEKSFVNIVGHTKVPYGVVRKIVTSCQVAGFANVNLATQPKG